MKTKEQIKELKSMKNPELVGELKKSYEELRKLRFQAKMRELKDVARVNKTKIKIAQILTILREKIVEEVNEEKT